ncbi:MAG: DUF3618 domain-containing protein [Verrucomicrobiales bacterium]|nr:DUF3618 domain-containing protein [Verrucomicrobiales bacterium]
MNRIDQYSTPESETFRDPETIENQIVDTRKRMDHTIEKLGDKLDPREYLGAASDWAEKSFGEIDFDSIADNINSFGSKITTGIKNNPIPTALVGTAAVMLLLPKRSRNGSGGGDSAAQNDAGTPNYRQRVPYSAPVESMNGSGDSDGGRAGHHDRVWDKLSDLPEKTSSIAKDAGNLVAEKTRAGGEAISSTSQTLAKKTGETARKSKKRFERSTQESPGLIGAGALALGFLAAIAIPRTRKENELCGEASDQLKSRIKDRIDDATPSIEELKDSSIEKVDSLADEACEKVEEAIAPDSN